MKPFQYVIVLLINLAIAFGFYWDGKDANASFLSGDQANIVPVCQKLDNPDWFKNDLYLNDIDNVAYYTPSFVETLRFSASLYDGNYFQGLNFMGFWTHLAYGLLWFTFLYTLRRDFWTALFFSLLMRGVIWPPGGELLGISDLWTIIPRTLYGALLPLPYLLYYYLPKGKVFISAFVLGLLLNLHPISGVGGIVAYVSAFALYLYAFEKKNLRTILSTLTLVGLGILLGMLPYLLQYFSTVSSAGIDQELFQAALNLRLRLTFSDPIVFIAMWNRPILYFLLAFMLLLYFVDDSPRKSAFYCIGFSALIVFVSANLSVYIEQAVNAIAGTNLRLSFQLIRFQKYILMLFQIAMYLAVAAVIARYAIRWQWKAMANVTLLIMASFSMLSPVNKIPLLGDDLGQSLLPNSWMVKKRLSTLANPDRIALYEYAKDNTPRDAVFFGHTYVRAAGERSVVLDMKGASMLIEGNQQAFIQWYLDRTAFDQLTTQEEKIQFLREYGVDYLTADEPWPLEQVKRVGKSYLYRL